MKFTHISVPLVLAVLVSTVMAEERDHGRDGRDHGGPWRGEIHKFHESDIGIWRRGHWVHGRHDGRIGWWWIVRGVWYFYPVVVYPYPDPYQPPVAAVPPTAPQYWYQCSNPAGYYPYVAQCASGWQKVPATPPPASPAPPAPPTMPAPPGYPR